MLGVFVCVECWGWDWKRLFFEDKLPSFFKRPFIADILASTSWYYGIGFNTYLAVYIGSMYYGEVR